MSDYLLKVVHGVGKEEKLVISDTVIIGRGNVDLRFSDPKISRQHCTLILMSSSDFLDTYYVAKDGYLNSPSRNGTFVNGKKLVGLHNLQHQDVITLGLMYPQIIFLIHRNMEDAHSSTISHERE